jgi:hypothetical protein
LAEEVCHVHVMMLLLENQSAASLWGSSLKMLVSILAMFIVGIAAFIWWAKRG